MATSSSTEYLRFSAYSLKELITRKLASETKFTDQVYEGSNLAILIDIVCYMYQCMIYNLNNTAAEAMWSDTQVYENISRLAKIIGYNPKGATPATAVFVTDTNTIANEDIDCYIPKYALIDTKKTDENGKRVYYSTISESHITNSDKCQILMYNGIWKMYSTVFAASGEKYQTLLLDELTSSDDDKTYVPQNMIDIYIDEQPDNDAESSIEQWSRVEQGLFTDSNVTNGSSIYSEFDKIYSVRLNENKQYEITFGNGFNGKIPKKGSAIYIFYLDSNGPQGTIDLGEVSNASIMHDPSCFGMTQKMYDQIFKRANYTLDNGTDPLDIVKDKCKWENITSSTIGKAEEDVESIRTNAPQAFKTANRLVTASDWEYYVKNRFSDNIVDVVCQNNYTYISSFYRWLYNLGVERHDNPQYYLTKNRIVKYDYKFADAHDSNNVYLWIKMKNDMDIYKETIDEDVNKIKLLTQEAVYLKPLDVCFMFCAQDVDEVRAQLYEGDTSFTGNYLEITISDNTLYTNSDITLQIIKIISDYFSDDNFTLGATVDNNDLTNKIFELGTISRVRTIYKNDDTGIERIFPGISFASWTDGYVDTGDDVEVTTVTKTLEPFQFPKFYSFSGLAKKIKVIKKSVGQLNNVQY